MNTILGIWGLYQVFTTLGLSKPSTTEISDKKTRRKREREKKETRRRGREGGEKRFEGACV